MNITSYNVTDVGYHYIGLRVLAGLPASVNRTEQTGTISRNIRKYVSDKALRLMLPEPRGTFETAGEKVCQELVHLKFARSLKGAYEITDTGKDVLRLLDSQRYQQLRRVMIEAHLRTYDNLRTVIQEHLSKDGIWQPVVEMDKIKDPEYVTRLLEPTFGDEAGKQAEQELSTLTNGSSKKLEDALRKRVLGKTLPQIRISVPIFKSFCDRLVSLRLLNLMKVNHLSCDFDKSYTPCVLESPPHHWYAPLSVELNSGESFLIYLSEPDMADPETREELLEAIYKALEFLTPTAGYYSLPEVRDCVCEYLKIPEAAFDEGVNRILDLDPRPVTVGLQYEGITGRRKPLVRERGATHIYNLIRRS